MERAGQERESLRARWASREAETVEKTNLNASDTLEGRKTESSGSRYRRSLQRRIEGNPNLAFRASRRRRRDFVSTVCFSPTRISMITSLVYTITG